MIVGNNYVETLNSRYRQQRKWLLYLTVIYLTQGSIVFVGTDLRIRVIFPW